MKIQELAIIFIIIILPISLLLSEYTQFQIQTLKTQTEYDASLTSATYDAIRAFQLNSTNSTTSDLANSKMRDLEASVNTFRNSIMSAFKLNGYTTEALDNYIPALVYTLYDGFYIYSPYENTHDESGNRLSGQADTAYGFKPYINYSCRYVKGNIDVVITYALDNYVTVQGTIGNEYVNKSGHLIDNITVTVDTVIYNGVTIEIEQLKENLGGNVYNYAKVNGTKYYYLEDYLEQDDGTKKDCIIYISNGTPLIQYKEGDTQFISWKNRILNNDSAKQYYRDAEEFTEWFKSTGLKNLTYGDAIDEVIAADGTTTITNVWTGNTTKIFDFNSGVNASDNIENELSNFNQHRLAVIRHKIETNLAIAISNYNSYSEAISNVFQMPELKEDEWEQITHNISLISFLQGLPIGGKIYNGYSLVTNSESKEVVLEENIYILGSDKNYHKIGDKGFEDGTVSVDEGDYGHKRSAGRLNLDFERNSLINSASNSAYYYYPLTAYNASYDSVVMQNNVTTYDDIYEYVNSQSYELKEAFYTALGRERVGMYKTQNNNLLGENTSSTTTGTNTPSTPIPTPELDTYYITYDANGGEGAPEKQEKNEGDIITISATEPTRTGYKFLGWSTSSSATSAEYSGGDLYATDADVTLYAVWSTDQWCMLILDANGGTLYDGREVLGLATVSSGTSYAVPDIVPSRDGYTFVGWATNSTATTAEYALGDTVVLYENITLYAVWQSTTVTYTITYWGRNGTLSGTFADGDMTKTDTTEETTYELIEETPTCLNTAYIFTGWSDGTSTDAMYQPGESITLSGSLTLYPIYKMGYTITFDANGGTFSDGTSTLIITVLKGEKIPTTPIPTKSGYGISKWKNTSTNTEYSSVTSIQPTSNMTFKAVWVKNSSGGTVIGKNLNNWLNFILFG